MTEIDPHAVLGAESDGSVSFYFFDIDDNLLFLPTEIILTNAATGEEKPVSTEAFAEIDPHLGKPGAWEDWTAGADAFRNFSDPPGAAPEDTPFIRDLRAALACPNGAWKGPSWKFFEYACEKGRPTAYITARGHAPETIAAGLALLAEAGFVAAAPEVLAIFPVGDAAVQAALGGVGHPTPTLKRAAIRKAVDAALARYGAEPPHRFGMSDDDPRNVQSLIRAMHACKKDYANKRFFVIDTHRDEHLKLEVLSMDRPAPRSG